MMKSPAGLDRRAFLGSGVAAAATLATTQGASAQDAPPDVRETADVVVIGAGFSGLAAALRIAAGGLSVRVLEARDRVGGRVVNHALDDGRMIEAGGQFVGPTQNRMFELSKEYGIGTYPAYDTGRMVSVLDGKRHVGGPPAEIQAEFDALVARLTAMSREIVLDAPWTSPKAREWDSLTLETWIAQHATRPETTMLFSSVADLWGATPRDLSLLFALFYIAAAGDTENPGTLERLLELRDGAQEQRIHGGSHLLAQKMAEKLGDRLTLSSPVRRIIRHEDGHAEVISDRMIVSARRVIVALPPALAANIWFEPELPTLRSQLVQRLPMGSLIKVTAIYERPFWREAGLSGISLNIGMPIHSTFDNTLPDGGPGIILGFVGGDAARAWANLDAATRRRQALDSLAAMFGDEALEPLDYFDQDWPADPWSRGGPVGIAPPGVLLDYGKALRMPVGPIHWAGTETATYWNGYMEGAVQAGERAAGEVLAALG